MELEINILNLLKNKTTLAIPNIQYIGKSKAYIGYQKINGIPLTTRIYTSLSLFKKLKIAKSLAQFLFEIHQNINLVTARKLGIKSKPKFKLNKSDLEKLTYQSELKVFNELTKEMLNILKRTSLKNPISTLYNDLQEGNIAFNMDKQIISGIFDFGDMKTGDLHEDFTDLFKISPDLTFQVIKYYNLLSNTNLEFRRVFALAWAIQLKLLLKIDQKKDSVFYKHIFDRLKIWNKHIKTYIK